MNKSRILSILGPLVSDGKLTWDEVVAIYRCLLYSDQIADVSIGNIFRPIVLGLLDEA